MFSSTGARDDADVRQEALFGDGFLGTARAQLPSWVGGTLRGRIVPRGAHRRNFFFRFFVCKHTPPDAFGSQGTTNDQVSAAPRRQPTCSLISYFFGLGLGLSLSSLTAFSLAFSFVCLFVLLPLLVPLFVQAEILDVLAQKGADLNERTSTEATLAHVAARDGHSGCLKVLCDWGADVDAVNQLGNTPIMFAAMAGDVDVSFFSFSFSFSVFGSSRRKKRPCLSYLCTVYVRI